MPWRYFPLLIALGTVAAFAQGQAGNCQKDYSSTQQFPIIAAVSPWGFLFLPHLDLASVTIHTMGHETIYDFKSGSVFYDGMTVDYFDPTSAPDEIKNACGPDFLKMGDLPAQGPYPPMIPPGDVRVAPRAARPLDAAQSAVAGQASQSVAIGDFNGDGVDDSAVLTVTGFSVTLFASGLPPLSTANYKVTGVGSSITAGDFNGDGVQDLAMTQNDDSGQGNVVVMLGNGDGTFGPAGKFPVGDFAFYLAAADFNGDGVLDLAVTNIPNRGTGTVVVMLGHGDGTFAQGVSYPVGAAPGTIVAADFNGDGVSDLAALDAAAGSLNKVWVLPGHGDGTFGTAVSTPTGTGSGYLSYGDLNHDGNVDLVIADQTASAMTLMMGNGDGTFQAPSEYVIGPQPLSIAVVPLGDGNTSLFTQDNLTGGTFFTFATSDGSIVTPQLETLGTRPTAIGAADVNGDGQPDLVITDSESRKIWVKLGVAGGTFGTAAGYAVGSQPGALALADVNHDGFPDAIVADLGAIEVLLGNGDGTFGAAETFAASGPLNSIAVADFNSDGQEDVAAANGGSGGVSIFIGNGDGTFQTEQTVFLGGGQTPLAAVTGDFNGDGLADLVVAYKTADFTQPGGLAVFLGNGDGTFQSPMNVALPSALVTQGIGAATWAALTVADFNGDGKPDVITALKGFLSNQVAVLLGNGDGTFQAPLLTNTNTAPPTIVATDLNGDGVPDLVLGDCCLLTEASMLYGNGDGTFQNEVQFPSGPSPLGIAAMDFNGDGLPDLAVIGKVQQPDRGTLAIMLNPGEVVSSTPDSRSLPSRDR